MKRYPMGVALSLYITDGEQVGSVNYTFGFGHAPTDEQMPAILEKVKAVLPDGFRLMNRAEATMHYLREEKGYRGPNMHIPPDGKLPWFDPETDISFTDLNNEPEIEDEN